MPPLSLSKAYVLLRYSIAFIWIFTAIISTLVSPELGYELLKSLGITGWFADLCIFGTSAIELVLGACLIMNRWVRPLALVQVAMIIGFTLIITAAPGLRELWLHPFAPVGKNIPILGGLAILYALGENPERKPS